MWLMLEVYDRLSYYMSTHCEGYETNWLTIIMTFLSAGPYIIYFVAAGFFLYEKTVWWMCVCTGLMCNALVIKLLGMTVPLFVESQGLCGGIIHDRPSEEVAIVFYIFAYWLVDSMAHWRQLLLAEKPECVTDALPRYWLDMDLSTILKSEATRLVRSTFLWLAIAVSCAYSQVFLHIFNWTQVVLGGSVGLGLGALSSYLYNVHVAHRFKHKFIQLLVRWCCLDPHRPRVW